MRAAVKWSVAVMALVAMPSVSGGQAVPSRTRVLDNGASVVVRQAPGSEVTVMKILLPAGLSNEGRHAGSGISHLVEHLVFKGTRDMASEEVTRHIRSLGGLINGFAGLDMAGYHMTVPNEHFEEGLRTLVRLVMDLEFTEEDFRKERQVIMREMNMHWDDPVRRLTEELFSEAWSEHVYGYPVIGYLDRFERLTADDARAYHAENYTPDRLVLGISGDLDSKHMIGVAEKVLGGYERGEAALTAVPGEPGQLIGRERELGFNVNLAHLAIGYRGVDMFSPEVYPLDVLSIVLGRGRDSRLHQRLVRDKELLHSVSAYNMAPRYPGLFVITGTGDAELLEEAEREIYALLDGMRDAHVTDEEVERARNIVAASFLRGNESTRSKVSAMARSQLFTGSPDYPEEYVKNIRRVTAREVQRAIERYFVPSSSTVVRMFPGEYFSERVAEEPTITAESAPPTVTELDNGLKVIVKERPRLPLVSVNISFDGGVRAETGDKSGISRFTARTMLKGTTTRGEEKIVPVFERMGGSISSHSGRNTMGLSMTVLADDLEKAMDIFADVVMDPVFPEEEIDKLRRRTIAGIRQQSTRIVPEGMRKMRQLLYGHHPYGMRASGEIETVEALTREDLAAFASERVRPYGAVLSVVGDVDSEKLVDLVSRKFRAFEGVPVSSEVPAVEDLPGIVSEEMQLEKEQALLLLGFHGVDLHDPARYALEVLDNMLSGGGGRLFRVLRDEMGLAYSCGAHASAAPDRGVFIVYVLTTEQELDSAEEAAIEVIRDIRDGLFTDEELSAGRNRLLTSLAGSFQTNSSLAEAMSAQELLGMGYDHHRRAAGHVRAVTREDVMEAARKVFLFDRYATVVVRPGDQ